MNGRSPDRVLMAECQRLLDSVLEIARLAAWPETVEQAQIELELLRREYPSWITATITTRSLPTRTTKNHNN